MSAFTGSKMEIEFTPGTFTDVTEDCKMPVEIKSGRATPFDEIGPTRLEFVLRNPVGDYTPGNTSGAHSPNVKKGVNIRWTVTKGGVDYVRFYGPALSFKASWPQSGDYTKGTTSVVAVSPSSRLAQRKLMGNFTETALWRGREDSVFCDAYEASGQAGGAVAFLTNYSADASPGGPSAIYSGDIPTLTFGDDKEISAGGVVTSNTGTEGTSCTTMAGFQANPLQIIMHMKCPSDLLDSSLWTCATFYNAASAAVCNLVITQNGTLNGLFLMNANNTTNLGIVANLPFGQWVRITLLQNSGTATRLNVIHERFDGSSGTLSNVNLDIRTIRSLEVPGGIGKLASCSWGGIAALGTRTGISMTSSFVAGVGATWAGRVTAISDICERSEVTIGYTGSDTTDTLLTGSLAGRSALDVLREIARSASGIVWDRPRDGKTEVIASDLVRPASSIATISVVSDCDGPPALEDSVENEPTRVTASWPGGSAVAVDSAAEAAGESRNRDISTVCSSASAAQSVAATDLAVRSLGVRVARVTLDLTTGETDHTAAMFGAAGELEGLYPTARITLSDMTPVLGSASVDMHVEGWQETYNGTADVTLRLDTSPAS